MLKNKYPSLFILVMGANANICDGFTFKDEFDLALQTWAKELPDNVGLVYYDGGSYMKTEFDQYKNKKNVWILHLACEDDMKWTFKKTWMAYKFIYDKYKADWIFRTNTSTYVNVPVLNDFIHNLASPNVTYGSDLYSLSEACCPWPLCIYPRGNGILTNKNVYKPTIVDNGIMFAYQGICDDIAIGNLINSWNINNGKKYLNYIQGLPHAWYRCVDQVFDNGHKFSKFGDSNLNYNDFVTITVKKYREREKEKDHYLELDKKMHLPIVSKISETLWTDEMIKYVKDPSIFIGSILGYIDFDKWKQMDKNELYLLEISHKASDDEQHYIYKEIQGMNI